MSVLVTGGAGYIGSHMTLALLARGEEVAVVDDLRTGFEWALPEGVTFARGDIGNAQFLDHVFAAHKPETVLHFAGSVVVPESVADPLGYYANNTANSRQLVATAVRHDVQHFVFSSTAAVYGTPSDNPVGETADLRPISPYGRSKLMTEMMLEDAAHAHDIRYAALRYFNVAGADPQGRIGQSTKGATHLIKVACEAALGLRDHVAIFGTDYPTLDGTAVRDYIHVSDLVTAHLDAIDYLRGGNASIVCNVGYGRGFSVREVLESIRIANGKDFDIRTAERRAGDPAIIVADGRTARQKLGWTPKYDDLHTIVADALRWEDRLRSRNEG